MSAACRHTSFACGERSTGFEASASAADCFAASSAFILRKRVRAAARRILDTRHDEHQQQSQVCHKSTKHDRINDGKSIPRSFCRLSPGVASRNDALAIAASRDSKSFAASSAATALSGSFDIVMVMESKCFNDTDFYYALANHLYRTSARQRSKKERLDPSQEPPREG